MKVEHGGNMLALAEQFGYKKEDCLDFSANINPLGLSDHFKKGLAGALEQVEHYPDIHYRKSRECLAKHHHLTAEQILLSNGAVELFYELARLLKPARVLTLSPTFMEYEKAFSQVGSRILHHVLTEPTYSWKFEKMLPQLSSLESGDLVVICNPNNPTGTLARTETMCQLAAYLLEKKVTLLIDEAFMDFLEDEELYSFIPQLKNFPNAIVVRSLTKFYAIPGLRLGYAVSSHMDYLREMDEKRAPWTVNALADALLPHLLEDKEYVGRTRNWLKEEQSFFYQALSKFTSLIVVEPTVNYIFFKYEGPLDLRSELWKEKIFIRSCKNYHHLTDQHYRVAIRSHAENEIFLTALSAVLEGEKSYD